MSLNLTDGILELVGVVGDVDLLLPDQLPVVAVDRAVEHVELVGGAHVVGRGARVVVGDVRGAADAALARVVEPRAARLLDLVERLVHEQDAAGEARGREDFLLEEEDLVVQILFGLAGHAVEHVELVVELDERVVAAAGRRRLRDGARGAVGAVAEQVIPDRLDAALRHRERDAVDRAGDAVAVLHEACAEDALVLRRVVDPLRERGAPVRRVDVHLVGLGVGLEQRDLSRREVRRVLVDVRGGDREERPCRRRRGRRSAAPPCIRRAGS